MTFSFDGRSATAGAYHADRDERLGEGWEVAIRHAPVGDRDIAMNA